MTKQLSIFILVVLLLSRVQTFAEELTAKDVLRSMVEKRNEIKTVKYRFKETTLLKKLQSSNTTYGKVAKKGNVKKIKTVSPYKRTVIQKNNRIYTINRNKVVTREKGMSVWNPDRFSVYPSLFNLSLEEKNNQFVIVGKKKQGKPHQVPNEIHLIIDKERNIPLKVKADFDNRAEPWVTHYSYALIRGKQLLREKIENNDMLRRETLYYGYKINKDIDDSELSTNGIPSKDEFSTHGG